VVRSYGAVRVGGIRTRSQAAALPMDDEPDDDLIREVYARFGLAYYKASAYTANSA
jgi:hypothetical protein